MLKTFVAKVAKIELSTLSTAIKNHNKFKNLKKNIIMNTDNAMEQTLKPTLKNGHLDMPIPDGIDLRAEIARMKKEADDAYQQRQQEIEELVKKVEEKIYGI